MGNINCAECQLGDTCENEFLYTSISIEEKLDDKNFFSDKSFNMTLRSLPQKLEQEEALHENEDSESEAPNIQIELSISEQKYKESVIKIELFWIAYCTRKQFLHYKNQQKLPYLNFAEMYETVGKNPIKFSSVLNSIFRYKSGALYKGDWLGGFRHGHGIMKYPDGATFEGEWKYGMPFGHGKFTHLDKDSFEGQFKGTNSYEDKDGYNWLLQKQTNITSLLPTIQKNNPKKDSKLEFITAKLHEMKTEIKKYRGRIGTFKFYNEYMYENRTVYTGEWQFEKRAGRGKCEWTSGDIYKGEWANDKQHGIGLLDYGSGNSYIGKFFKNTKHGLGKFQWTDGSTYYGQWFRNHPHGIGECKWSIHKKYIGYWKGGVRAGYGCMYYSSTKKYVGEFKDDKPDGLGTLFKTGEVEVHGIWRNGKIFYKY